MRIWDYLFLYFLPENVSASWLFKQIQWWKSGWVILGPRWVFSVYSFRINKPNNYIIYLLHLSLQHKWEATMSCSNLPSRIQSTLILQTPESLVGVMGKKGYKVSTFFSLNRQRENWVHFGGCSWGVLFAKMLVEVTITCDIISDSSITQLYRQLSATGVFFLGGGRGGCEFCHYGNNNKIPLCMANCTTGLLEKKQNKKLTQIKLLICWHLSMIWQQLNPLCEFFLCMFKMKKCVGNKKTPKMYCLLHTYQLL